MEKIPNEDEIMTVVYNFIVDSSITEDELNWAYGLSAYGIIF